MIGLNTINNLIENQEDELKQLIADECNCPTLIDKLKQDIKNLQQIKQDLERLQKQDDDIKSGELSDGYHTFNDLYYQRCILFATLVNQNKKTSWKSYKHEDGELCFGGGWFIVGIDTPLGSYTYHYENKYWDLFQCKELECGKHWDGHTSKDVDRLLSIENEDLEVLEILREHLVLIPTGTNKEQLFIATDITNYLSEKDKEKFNKVKQWLEVNE